jgi:Heterokaryon incompatibility protein (HET)
MAYIFEPLEDTDRIRLLTLQPTADNDASLIATLSHVSLAAKPTFEAISYVWGEPVFSQEVQLPEGTLAITENLSNALRRFRLTDLPRALWADQICIYLDQS